MADFRPETVEAHKIKKAGATSLTVHLTATPDILTDLVSQRRAGQVIVGFAAETGDDAGSVLEHGRAKALRKGTDLTIVNAVGPGIGFAVGVNDATILDARGEVVAQRTGTKDEVAEAVWDSVVALLGPASS